MAQFGASRAPASSEIELTSTSSRKSHHHGLSWSLPQQEYHKLESDDQAVDHGVTSVGTREHSPNNVQQAVPRREISDTSTVPADPFMGIRMQHSATEEPNVLNTSYGEPAPEYGDGDVDTADRSYQRPMGISQASYQDIPPEASLIQHTHSPHEHSHVPCPTQGDVLKAHWGWFPYTILSLAVFSTVFSAIFFGIAVRKPRWGHSVGTVNSSLSYNSATLLTALFSKLIELSFACVFVATLGQILSRRAFMQNARTAQQGGISIAEMNMRQWILQPGTLITNWDGVKYTFKTVLGGLALLSAIAAALYITAAEALVSPKLEFGRNETMVVTGNVTAVYANITYLAQTCETPLYTTTDTEVGATCMQIRYAGQGFRNLDYWMSGWATQMNSSLGLATGGIRPPPVAMLHDNTTVQGQWIFPQKENITADSARFGRLVHNVTMAMPHANVFHAVRDSRNSILQPEDLSGSGEYRLQASVPAPALNVLCVGMTAAEVLPLISGNETARVRPSEWPVRTAVDDIFGWDMSNTSTPHSKPFFAVTPKEFNTVVSKDIEWGPNAIYLLATPPSPANTTSNHVLCALRSMIYHHCTTSYHVAQSGGELAVHCNYADIVDGENTLPYSKSAPDDAFAGFDSNWVQIGIEWLKAVALSHNADASSARELTQMTPSWTSSNGPVLSTVLPSLGEALAVLAGCTLLMATDRSPFVGPLNRSLDTYQTPQSQQFNALLSYKDYASGSVQIWQGVFFYPVLLIVLLLNLFCLVYLVWIFTRDGEVTDYTEPQNLFALAINSPPSQSLAGSCGAGPSGHMLKKKWMVGMAAPTPRAAAHTSAFTSISGMLSPHVGVQHRYSHQNQDDRSTATTTGASHSNHPHFYVHCAEDDEHIFPSPLRTQTPVINYTHTSSNPSTSTTPQLGGIPSHPPPSRSHTPKNSVSSPLLGLGFGFNAFGHNNNNNNSSNNKSAQRRSRKTRSMANETDWTVEESPAVEQYMRLSGRS